MKPTLPAFSTSISISFQGKNRLYFNSVKKKKYLNWVSAHFKPQRAHALSKIAAQVKTVHNLDRMHTEVSGSKSDTNRVNNVQAAGKS